MKRIVDHFLLDWKNETYRRKPLLLRGARQVGKTHAVRILGKTFPHFVEINLETNTEARELFSKDLDARRIMTHLSELLKTEIKPGQTLLFIDEIQYVPRAIIALRYFYEEIPELHVIAAGSLLDFAIEQVGMPVGRITQLYMYPLSFMEFLVALGYERWAQLITSEEPVFDLLHNNILELVGLYLAIGGMPAAVNAWREKNLSREVRKVHTELLQAYIQDFDRYAKKHERKYLSLTFNHAMEQLSRKFMFSKLSDYRKREIEPAIELLEKAGVLSSVTRTDAQGIPIGAGIHLDDFKLIFLDVGLTQALLGYDLTGWILKPLDTFVNKGELVEAFVGQELLAYSDPISKGKLYYWRSGKEEADAETDYVIQLRQEIVPLEVKAGPSKRHLSLHRFLNTHPHSHYGIRFWAEKEQQEKNIYSCPLYAVSKTLLSANRYLKEALESLW